MSDPAVEAAQRAWRRPDREPPPLLWNQCVGSAREALAPVRAAYEDLKRECHNSTNPGIRAGLTLALARLAPLIFESDEDVIEQ